ncbi:MAG: hypothetical protein ACM3O6_11035 [Acidobacteriota bacterium]
MNGANQSVVEAKAASQVDLYRELIPTAGTGPDLPGLERCRSGIYDIDGRASDDEVRRCIDLAYRAFESDPSDLEIRRNRIFSQLIAASEIACSRFEQNLNTIQSDFNFFSGLATVGTGGAGAILTPGNTSRILSGLAGIAGGTRAEFNADFFYQHAAGIIVKAIDAQRAQLRAQFAEDMKKPYENFNVGLAVASAIRYNHTCSLVEGLLLADTQLNMAQNPGLDMFMQTLPKLNLVRKISQNGLTPSQVAGEVAAAVSTSGAASPATDTGPNGTALQALASAVRKVSRQYAATQSEIATFAAANKPTQDKDATDALSALKAFATSAMDATHLQSLQAGALAIDKAAQEAAVNLSLVSNAISKDDAKISAAALFVANAQAATKTCISVIDGYASLASNPMKQIAEDGHAVNTASPKPTLQPPDVSKRLSSWGALLPNPAPPASACSAPPTLPPGG